METVKRDCPFICLETLQIEGVGTAIKFSPLEHASGRFMQIFCTLCISGASGISGVSGTLFTFVSIFALHD